MTNEKLKKNTSKNFGHINYYSTNKLIDSFEESDIILMKRLGIRSTYGLSGNNSIKYNSEWYENMFELEKLLSNKTEFLETAFYNHLIFKRSN
ncbi:hypothetical protein BW731_02675 [Vagococcus martis]|uniref:Uncharacterized protein n=1 Tax=Vagococcus martis TaxID=1768210 RepID=A0A1V4DFD2_9ENTE|nr:hypothetical protein BW731_02675 [Vagococcus martis]